MATILLTAPASAQTAGSTNTATTGGGEEQLAEVAVTGSLITRRDFQSNSPIATISSSVLQAAGQPSLDRAIGELPQFAASQGASEVGDAQGSIGFAGGQSYSDLRGLGPNRSLVLLDGRRLMSSSPNGAIDLNTIPSALIENVEVITGGASAAYGSDAVAGVVNFKLRRNFSGIEVTAQRGAASRGDGQTNTVSAVVGGAFADERGHALLAIEYSDRSTVAGSDRSFFANIRQLARPPDGIIAAGNYGGGAPTVAAVNAVLASYPGTTPIAGTGNYTGAIGVNTDGTIFTDLAGTNCVQNYRGLGAVKGLNISSNCRQVQVALGQYFAVMVPLTKHSAFASLKYDLGDRVTAYSDFNFLESSAVDQTGPGSSKASVPLLVPQNNPFVTGNAGLQQILTSITPAPTGNIIVTKLLNALGNRVEQFKYNVWQGLVGLKGSIPGSELKWDVYGSYGHSLFNNYNYGDASLAAITTVLNGTANYTGAGGTCKGYAWNPLGNNALSPGCLQYVGRVSHNVNDQSQSILEGTLQGPLFRLPAGDLSFALGADQRKTSFNYLPDSVLVTNDSLPYGSINAASGQQKVSEVYGELLVPLLKDRPLAQDLSLDLGYRHSSYDRSGGAGTYKGDVSWKPSSALRFRGGYSVAIRAPSLGDLYGPTSVSQLPIGTGPNAGDPCAVGSIYRTGANASQVQALCIAQGIPSAFYPTYTYGVASVSGSDGSNASLTPEKAKTYSFGVVLTPHFGGAESSGLQVSLDYFHIKITDAIGSLLLTDILPRCFNSDGASNPGYSVSNAYCQRITRDPLTGVILLGQQGLFNFATYTVAGIDAQLNGRFGLDKLGMSTSAGNIDVNVAASYLKEYTVAGLLGSPTLNYAGSVGFGGVGGDISHPHWKINTALTYGREPLSVTLLWRFVGQMIHSDVVANPASTTAGVQSYNYLDLNGHYDINKRFTVGVGVTNLTDKAPPFVSAAPLTTDSATYDVIGRTWFANIKAKL
jgi:outer membrane receptor protein involved in Fe transport